jgi:hypothetical protein
MIMVAIAPLNQLHHGLVNRSIGVAIELEWLVIPPSIFMQAVGYLQTFIRNGDKELEIITATQACARHCLGNESNLSGKRVPSEFRPL